MGERGEERKDEQKVSAERRQKSPTLGARGGKDFTPT